MNNCKGDCSYYIIVRNLVKFLYGCKITDNDISNNEKYFTKLLYGPIFLLVIFIIVHVANYYNSFYEFGFSIERKLKYYPTLVRILWIFIIFIFSIGVLGIIGLNLSKKCKNCKSNKSICDYQ